ncbi:SDR family NAD(P)-dependent oxidoreductase [Methylobacterium aquaticum]|uniref:SDR family NAD(P)-dependent oxidoreductase n=1 Tax=Methylobacterium aquaticum TaxID=270351 RepID=UPI003D7C206C
MAGQHLAREGHEVVLHARSDARDEAACRALPEAAGILIGDVVTIAAMRAVAAQANATGRFDAVIHNVGIGYREPRRIPTADGLSHLFAINVLTPYLLTALIERPDRRVYLSSGMHPGGAGHGRPSMGAAALERVAGLRREQVPRRGARLRGCAPVAGRAGERARAGMGPDADGRSGRTGRPGPGSHYPGLAGRERRAPRPLDGTLLLPPGDARAGPAHAGRGVPGRASGCLRAADGRPLTAMTIGLGSTDATDRTGP